MPAYQLLLEMMGMSDGDNIIVSYGPFAFFSLILAVKNVCGDNPPENNPFYHWRSKLSNWMEFPYRSVPQKWSCTINNMHISDVNSKYRGSLLALEQSFELDYNKKAEFISGVKTPDGSKIMKPQDYVVICKINSGLASEGRSVW